MNDLNSNQKAEGFIRDNQPSTNCKSNTLKQLETLKKEIIGEKSSFISNFGTSSFMRAEKENVVRTSTTLEKINSLHQKFNKMF